LFNTETNSASVQHTLYDMGSGVLKKSPGVDKIELYMVRASLFLKD